MDLPFMTVSVAVLMAFPVLRLIYMDQQFENYLTKIKAMRDKVHESGDQTMVQKSTTMWKDTLAVSEKNRTNIKYDFFTVFAVLVMGWAVMNGTLDFISCCWVENSPYAIIGAAGGYVLSTFMYAFRRMNRIKKDVNEIIFEI